MTYNDPDDPALWVPKRHGIGWTLNFAHRRAWVIAGVLLAAPVVAIVLGILVGR
jgi:uncharacterized membrane protein